MILDYIVIINSLLIVNLIGIIYFLKQHLNTFNDKLNRNESKLRKMEQIIKKKKDLDVIEEVFNCVDKAKVISETFDKNPIMGFLNDFFKSEK